MLIKKDEKETEAEEIEAAKKRWKEMGIEYDAKPTKKSRELSEEEIAAQESWENAKRMWTGMTKKEKNQFVLITTVILIFFAMMIAGGIVLGITQKPWLLIAGIVCFVGFGFSFPIVSSIKRKTSFKAISKSKMAIEGEATVTDVRISWQMYTGGKLTGLTLEIRCDINGQESLGWYKFNKNDFQYIWFTDSLSVNKNGEKVIEPSAIDAFIKKGDRVIIRYILEKPKYCVIVDWAK